MTFLSDILFLFSTPLNDADMRTAKATLMDTARSVLVHQKEGQSRILVVKFDPHDTSPQALLSAVRDVGLDAKLSLA